jgi:predicted phage tail protein
MALRKVKLYGKLAKLFGACWELDVSTVGEALRAINVNTRGQLAQYLSGEGAQKKYKISVKKKKNLISKEEINEPFGGGDIYITPTLQGSDEVFQIIVGVILIIVGILYDKSGTLLQIGIAMVLGGVAQLMAPSPNINSSSEEDQRTSTFFQGNANVIYQGGSVGIIYGRALVTPMPIAIAFNVTDIQTTTMDYFGTVEYYPLPGGGGEYRDGGTISSNSLE